METTPRTLCIRNVTKTYANGVTALNNLSLEINPGMYGLLGPNGAGKSTLMRILASLQEPDSGEVMFGNIDIIRQKSEIRKTLGYLPQEFGLLKSVTAESLLDQFAVLKGITSRASRKETVETLLKQTNLWEKRKQKVGGFSGGMKQRFGVAIALLGNPKLMIVDEPTAGLDPAERVRFLNLLSEVGENSVVILSTHLVEDVAELCTNMAIISKGEILLTARPLEAIAAVNGKIWKRFITKDQLDNYRKNYPVISTKLLGGKTLVHVYSNSDPGDNFQPTPPDLEDVYFSAMGGFVKNI